jgi:hypothetical protein
MKIKMRIYISGTHNGVPWPLPGQVVEVPDVLGAKLCANGSATPVAEGKAEEKAIVPDDAEKRGGLTTKTAPAKAAKSEDK